MKAFLARIWLWFDSEAEAPKAPASGIDWLRIIPFIALHAAGLAAFWVGVSAVAAGVAAVMYAIRMFAITGFYHRYFSHRAFKTSRALQFVFAFIAAMSAQRGPLWWAAHHRQHHLHSDRAQDPHSPRHGFWRSHIGWFLDKAHFATRKELIKDFYAIPELRLLDRYDVLAPITAMITLYALGAWLESVMPQWRTNGWQMLVWGFFISTLVLYHATFSVNSVAHLFGSRRYPTRDLSRNNPILAMLTFGEGWHNNHHHYPVAARQGFYWWELDITWYALKVMAWLGLVWDLRPLPGHVRAAYRVRGYS